MTGRDTSSGNDLWYYQYASEGQGAEIGKCPGYTDAGGGPGLQPDMLFVDPGNPGIGLGYPDAVIRWQSSASGTVNVNFSLTDVDTANLAGSDGVTYQMFENGTALDNVTTVANAGSSGTITFTKAVTSGTTFDLHISAGGWKSNDETGVVFNVTTTPEPSAIALLATGLIALLAYAWRKRR